MGVKRCDMCFQEKSVLVPVLPSMPAMVCKACSYKVQQVLGFIVYHGGVLTYQQELTQEVSETIKSKKRL